jgi:hypothetical protein
MRDGEHSLRVVAGYSVCLKGAARSFMVRLPAVLPGFVRGGIARVIRPSAEHPVAASGWAEGCSTRAFSAPFICSNPLSVFASVPLTNPTRKPLKRSD